MVQWPPRWQTVVAGLIAYVVVYALAFMVSLGTGWPLTLFVGSLGVALFLSIASTHLVIVVKRRARGEYWALPGHDHDSPEPRIQRLRRS